MAAGGQERSASPAPVWARYAVAVGAVAVGALLRELLFHVPQLADLARQSPFSFLYPAVMAAALYGGSRPGVCAAVLALVLVATHLGPDGTAAGMPHEHDVPRLVLFVIVNVFILLICNRVHRARRDLKETLAAREASERRVTNTLEHITDAFFAVDRDFRFTLVNRQCEAFYGKSRRELLGRNFFDIFPEHLGGPVEIGARRAMAEQAPVHEEFFSPVKHRWVEGDVYPTPDGLSVYFRDVTERHAAREALRDSEARYRRLVETAQEGICQVDASGKVTYANRAMGRMLGVAPEAVAGKLLTDFVEGELTGPVERPPGAAALLQEARLRRADGSTFLAQISTSPLYREDGEHAGGPGEYLGELAVVTDVTERRAIETERQDLLRREQRARADAEAAIRRKDQFLAILSHELRTPLTPVIARLALLRRDPSLGATAKNGLEMIRRNVALEARLIDDLLDITRLSRGQLKLELTPVDAHQALRDALEIYEHEIERRHQRVETDLSAERHTVRADAVRLQQVFWNLIGNAVKYTPEGGTIRLRSSNPPMGGGDGNGASTPPRWLRVEVTDTGIGIEPDLMPRIFDPFEQGEQTLTRRYGGLGLGLSISRTLVQMHGGTLTASSAGRGKGATFTIELPAVAEPAEAAAPPAERAPELKPPAPEPVAQRATVQRILLVDDNDDTLRVMARLLRLSGHQVVTADSMATALHAATQPFDLLITDIGLPDGTGWDLMRTLCQRGPVRAIAISGFSMTDDVTRSTEVGFLQHLSKPVNPEELEQAIRRACASGRS